MQRTAEQPPEWRDGDSVGLMGGRSMDQRCGWETIEKKIRSWDCVCKMLKNVTIIIIILIIIHFIDMCLPSNAAFVIL